MHAVAGASDICIRVFCASVILVAEQISPTGLGPGRECLAVASGKFPSTHAAILEAEWMIDPGSGPGSPLVGVRLSCQQASSPRRNLR